jgi:hypothetical protein
MNNSRIRISILMLIGAFLFLQFKSTDPLLDINVISEITGFVNYDYNSSNCYASRMVSNFAIYPINQFGLINIDPGAKIVVNTKDEIIQGSPTKKTASFYYIFGNPNAIYSNFLKAGNENGYFLEENGKAKIYRTGFQESPVYIIDAMEKIKKTAGIKYYIENKKV